MNLCPSCRYVTDGGECYNDACPRRSNRYRPPSRTVENGRTVGALLGFAFLALWFGAPTWLAGSWAWTSAAKESPPVRLAATVVCVWLAAVATGVALRVWTAFFKKG